MADSGGLDARRAVTVIFLAAALLAGVEVVGSAYVLGVDGPCTDQGTRTPTAQFAVDADSDANLVVTHREGFTFTRRETVSLVLVVEDGETGAERRLNWRQADARVNRESANRSYPVGPGDGVTVESRLLGFDVDAGDTVTVVWTGYEPQLPTYCPNRDAERGPLLETVLYEGSIGSDAETATIRR